MKKNYLFKSLLLLMVVLLVPQTIKAGTVTLYSQNYESATDASTWTAPILAPTLITGDVTYGKYIQHSVGTSSSRSCQTLFYTTGNDFYSTYTSYTIDFDCAISAGNKDGSELVVACDGFTAPTSKNYYVFTANNNGANYLLNLANTGNSNSFTINQGSSTVSLTKGAWYHYKLVVDGSASTVNYTITLVSDGSTAATGTYTIPSGTSYKSQGLYFLDGRYYGVGKFDNISITTEVTADVANKPTITLTGISGTQRTYSITCADGETLHYKNVGDADYTSTTSTSYSMTVTTSGTIYAYTTNGTATSDVVSTDVTCENVTLAAPTYSVYDMSGGYGVTYKIAEDNSSVLLNPTATLSYVFTPNGGSAGESTTITDNTIAATAKGTYTVTASADGYTSATTTIDNTTNYTLTSNIDLTAVTAEDLTNSGWVVNGQGDSRWGLGSADLYQYTIGTTNLVYNGLNGITFTSFTSTPQFFVGSGLMVPYNTKGSVSVTNGLAGQKAVLSVRSDYSSTANPIVIDATSSYSLTPFKNILSSVKVLTPDNLIATTADYANKVIYDGNVASFAGLSTTDGTNFDLSTSQIGNSVTVAQLEAINTGKNSVTLLGNSYFQGKTGSANLASGGAVSAYNLSDGHTYASTSDFTAITASYDRTFTVGNISTVCLPFVLSSTTDYGSFYELSSVTDGELTFNSVTSTEAFKPYLFKPKSATPFTSVSGVTVKAATTNNTTLTDGTTKFTGVLVTTNVPNGSYGYQNGSFIKVNSDVVTVNPFRGYISYTTSTPAKLGVVIDGEVTSISNTDIMPDETPVTVFNVNGSKVREGVSFDKAINGLQKGVYIVNGKKIVK